MMKLVLAFAFLPLLSFASIETRITGSAAVEIYNHLSLPVTEVREEHTGMTYAKAKYGEKFGCERSLDSDSTYCWFYQEANAGRGNIRGAAALELYRSLDLKEEPVVDEHGNLPLGSAKYGKNIGCELTVGDSQSATCWFN